LGCTPSEIGGAGAADEDGCPAAELFVWLGVDDHVDGGELADGADDAHPASTEQSNNDAAFNPLRPQAAAAP
jgi:hypothetical protein